MRGLTLHQPYASAVAVEDKRHETRSWPTRYRGLLALQAAAADTREVYPTQHRVFRIMHPYEEMPLGAIVAVADLTAVERMTKQRVREVSEKEEFWGIWEEGRYSWRLENIRKLKQPIPFKGSQGLWHVPKDIQREIAIQWPRNPEIVALAGTLFGK